MPNIPLFEGPLGVPGDIILLLLGVYIAILIFKASKNGVGKDTQKDVVIQLGAIATSLTLVVERLSNLPNRAEVLNVLRTDIRHDIREALTPMVHEIDGLGSDVKELITEVRRTS